MKRLDLILICITIFFSCNVFGQNYNTANVAIKFSPNAGISTEICNSIGKQFGDVLILASKFSSKTLEKCLINIINSGRSVFLVLDSKFVDGNSSKLKLLLRSGVCVYSDKYHKSAHNKVVVSGSDLVFSGSYNFTDDSEYLNSENGIFIVSKEIHQLYKTEFNKHIKHSELVVSKFADHNKCTSL